MRLSCSSKIQKTQRTFAWSVQAQQGGGQFNLARQVPGKEEFNETLRYFQKQLQLNGVQLQLNKRIEDAADLQTFDEVVLATGVTPRSPRIDGFDHPMVVSYVDVLKRNVKIGSRVAIIGAGGIGFDIAAFLTHDGSDSSVNPVTFMNEWGIDASFQSAGGVLDFQPSHESAREVTLLQRKKSKVGKNLGKSTGWIHRRALAMRSVNMMNGCEYLKVDDEGLHILVDGEKKVLSVDNVIVCAGQEPLRDLHEPLSQNGKSVHLIGGADVAAELDAKRAIDQGTRLAAGL